MRRALIVVLLYCQSFAATTHFISTSGLNTNNGTSKATPWLSVPGMASCTSNCASYTPVAGDQFIFKGCETWTNAHFPINWDWSGTSGNSIYIGVDQTWFNTTNCPTFWNRPIFDGQNTMTNEFIRLAADNATHDVTLDNIEMKRQKDGDSIFSFNPSLRWLLSNLYIHAWNCTADGNQIVQVEAGVTFDTGVVDGSDSTGAAAGHCGKLFYSTPPQVFRSVIHDMPNAWIGVAGGGSGITTLVLAYNNIYNITESFLGTEHCNATETVGGGTYYIHDNLIHDMNCSGGESAFYGNSGENDFVFNNVWWNLGPSQTPSIGGQTGGISHWWNNTIVSSDTQSCINNGGQGAVAADMDIQNIHCVGGAGVAVSDFPAQTTNSIAQCNGAGAGCANANSSPKFDRYTASETFAYSPLAATNSTVGGGANLTSSATGNASGLTTDTTYACTQQTINTVVQSVCPARTANARPSSGAWDIGAYEFAASLPSVTPSGQLGNAAQAKNGAVVK